MLLCGELKSLTGVFAFSLLVGLAAFRLYLDEGEVSEDVGEHSTRAEVDAGLLDEGFLPILFSDGALAGDADLKCSDVAQADDFASLKGFGDYIFERHEYGKYITLVYGTSLLDAFGHFAEVDVTAGLHMAVELRFGFAVARVDTRGDGVGYISCQSSCVFRLVFVLCYFAPQSCTEYRRV